MHHIFSLTFALSLVFSILAGESNTPNIPNTFLHMALHQNKTGIYIGLFHNVNEQYSFHFLHTFSLFKISLRVVDDYTCIKEDDEIGILINHHIAWYPLYGDNFYIKFEFINNDYIVTTTIKMDKDKEIDFHSESTWVVRDGPLNVNPDEIDNHHIFRPLVQHHFQYSKWIKRLIIISIPTPFYFVIDAIFRWRKHVY